MTEYLIPIGVHRQRIIENLHAFLLELDPKYAWEVDVYKHAKPRTNPQNRALFGVAYKALEEQTGNDKDDLHTYFCGEFFGWKEETVMGRKRAKPIRTTTTDERGKSNVLPAGEFSKFYEFIQRRSAQNGYIVPDPEPLLKEALRAQQEQQAD